MSIADGLGLFARWRLASLSASEASKHAVRYLFTHIVMKGEAATGAGSPAESGDTSCLVRPLMLKRCAILAPLMLARCALALRGAPALIAPSMRGAARRLPRAPRPFASPLVARLSQGVEQAEKSDEEKARLKAEREERKEAKRLAAEEKKAAKAAKAAAALLEEEAANAPLAPIAFFRFDAEPAQRVGDYETTMSHGESGRDFKLAADLGRDGGVPAGESVWLRARVANVRSKGSSAFLVLRQGAFTTVQACLFKDKENPDESKRMLKVRARARARAPVALRVSALS